MELFGRLAVDRRFAYDRYSDFGEAINPRFALVWNTTFELTSKFLYGRAFRAPSFTELYADSNPVAVGNPSLEAETIDTFEIAFDYDLGFLGNLSANLFYYQTDDIVIGEQQGGLVVAVNGGGQMGYGGELQLKYRLSDQWQLISHYAYQKSDVDDDGAESDGAFPRHTVYSQLQWRPRDAWLMSGQVRFVGERHRASFDTREDLDSYVTVDFMARHQFSTLGYSVEVGLKNLFDDDVRDPSRTGADIQYDLPQEPRSVYLQFTWSR